jgi:hypothetical protein
MTSANSFDLFYNASRFTITRINKIMTVRCNDQKENT